MVPDTPRHCKPQQQVLPLKFAGQMQHGKDQVRNQKRYLDKLLVATLIPVVRRIDPSLCD